MKYFFSLFITMAFYNLHNIFFLLKQVSQYSDPNIDYIYKLFPTYYYNFSYLFIQYMFQKKITKITIFHFVLHVRESHNIFLYILLYNVYF